jgi:gliding motility-associated-like protein
MIKKIQFIAITLMILLSNKIISQGNYCNSADPFCTGTTYQFPNNTGTSAQSGPNYGCLGSQPNPAWYYMRIGTSGNIDITINQVNTSGAGIDVDFILWGPFNSPTGACTSQLTSSNEVDCSYSMAATETANITGAVAGQYYLLLITNFSNQAGNITFSQTGGSGTTDCSILCPIGQTSITTSPANTNTIACNTNTNIAYIIDEDMLPTGQSVTPCLQLEILDTRSLNNRHVVEVYEGSTLLGCFKPGGSALTCAPNAGAVPAPTSWDLFVSYLDPSLPHSFRLCEDNATTTLNMSYRVWDCYKAPPAGTTPIASGTWNVNNGTAYPTSCQSFTIPATGAGGWNFSGSSTWSISPSAGTLTNFNWGAANLNTNGMTPGTYTLTYNWNNGASGTYSCVGTQTRTLQVVNTSNAAWNQPSSLCVGQSLNLNTFITGTSGGAWSGSGVTASTFSATSAGTFAVNYLVGTGACTATLTRSITVNANPAVTMGANSIIDCAFPTTTLSASSLGSPTWSGPGIVSGANTNTVTISQAGTYTVTYNNAGCISTGTASATADANIPSVLGNVTNSITCVTSTAQVIGTTTVTPVNYTWTGPGTISSPTNSTTAVSAGGQYTLVVLNTANSCSTSITVNVPVNTTPVSASIAPPSTITCLNPNLTLSASPGTGHTYTWTTNPGLSGTSVSNPTVNAGGTYSVTITNTVNGCTGGTQVVVPSQTTPPVVNVSATGYTINCFNTNPTFSASATPSTNITYSWTAPATGTLNNSSISNPAPTGSGVFTVVVIDNSNGCTNTVSQATVALVTDLTVPTVTITPNTATLTCLTPTATAVVTASDPSITFTWSPAPFVGGLNPSFNAPGNYILDFTGSNGCVNGTSIDIGFDISTPTITLSGAVNDGTLTCTTLSVGVTPTITPSANTSYTWTSSSGSGISTSVNQAPATFTAPGVYTLSVENTNNGCVTTATNTAHTFTVYETVNTPTISLLSTSTNTFIGCSGSASTVSYSVNVVSTGSVNYNWLPNGVSTQTIDITSPGSYTLIVSDPVTNCADSVEFTVNTNTIAPQNVDAGSGEVIACGFTTTNLAGTSTNTNVSYSWTGPSLSSITSGSNTANPTVNETGNYTLTVTDNSTGCSTTATVSVTQGTINAAFTADTLNGIVPTTINFTDQSTGVNTFNWNFGDGNSSITQNPSNIYNSAGTFTVTLIVSAGPCIDTATAIIIIEDGLTLEIPNVFTPNGDGKNDIFTIKSTGVKEISLQIFNRWGVKLYEFSGPKAAWDGLNNVGQDVPSGTYFFFVKAKGYDGKEIDKHGTVNLFR